MEEQTKVETVESMERPVNIVEPASDNTYTYAGFWWRFLALLIDGFILYIIDFVIIALFAASLNVSVDTGVVRSGGEVAVSAIFGIILYGLPLVYFAWFESSKFQGTPGKMALGIKVTNINGEKISFLRALARNFCKVFSAVIFYIGFIMAGFTAKKQALHDIITECLVVKKV